MRDELIDRSNSKESGGLVSGLGVIQEQTGNNHENDRLATPRASANSLHIKSMAPGPLMAIGPLRFMLRPKDRPALPPLGYPPPTLEGPGRFRARAARLYCRGTIALQGGHKRVSSPRHCRDETVLTRSLAQHSSQQRYMLREVCLFDNRFRPDAAQQFIL